jgi:hypothetical protein
VPREPVFNAPKPPKPPIAPLPRAARQAGNAFALPPPAVPRVPLADPVRIVPAEHACATTATAPAVAAPVVRTALRPFQADTATRVPVSASVTPVALAATSALSGTSIRATELQQLAGAEMMLTSTSRLAALRRLGGDVRVLLTSTAATRVSPSPFVSRFR